MERTKRVKDQPRQFKRKMPKGYSADLARIVDEIFDAAYRRDWSWSDLARFAGVHYWTVWRMGERITRFPQLLTVWKLAKALQMQVTFVHKRASIIKDRRFAARA